METFPKDLFKVVKVWIISSGKRKVMVRGWGLGEGQSELAVIGSGGLNTYGR